VKTNFEHLLNFDREHIWHPYTSMINPLPVYPVVSASGVLLKLADGSELVDGMSSWWTAIHGYNNPVLNEAIRTQLEKMAHVMFGGITHEPAVNLSSLLVDITPGPLQKVFLCDSGSISVEVAMKMALQYWYSLGKKNKNKFLTIKSGYHGDTFNAMSVCDPVTGMHHIFAGILPQNYFAEAPRCRFDDNWDESFIKDFKQLIEKNHDVVAAVILEPVVQGAGGMRIYSPAYLKRVRELCDKYNTLLILDEIATGFGRTGRLFACEYADVVPDIMCVGKAMTGGYMTMAAVITTDRTAEVISSGEPGVFMHGPTFMGNPLACVVSIASINLLLSSPWQERVERIERQLKQGLSSCKDNETVADIRILGSIGVIETVRPVNVAEIQKWFVERGVWIRPFGKLIYIMPPYIINENELNRLINAMVEAVSDDRFLIAAKTQN
jgi:adenosylmethionine-8-amino-7-oxononanoate aminotransferase